VAWNVSELEGEPTCPASSFFEIQLLAFFDLHGVLMHLAGPLSGIPVPPRIQVGGIFVMLCHRNSKEATAALKLEETTETRRTSPMPSPRGCVRFHWSLPSLPTPSHWTMSLLSYPRRPKTNRHGTARGLPLAACNHGSGRCKNKMGLPRAGDWEKFGTAIPAPFPEFGRGSGFPSRDSGIGI
jgi:hypothetical protein